MAQKIQTLFIDDIDGGEAEGTVRFGLDGVEYEIDLNAKHTEELHKALTTYISHARKVGSPARRAVHGRRGSTEIDTAKVREWAKGNGFNIKDRGRVPADLVAKYQAATATLPAPTTTQTALDVRPRRRSEANAVTRAGGSYHPTLPPALKLWRDAFS
jgi:Lsr2